MPDETFREPGKEFKSGREFMLRFINELKVLSNSIVKLNNEALKKNYEELMENNELLKINNILLKDFYNMTDQHCQLIEQSIKAGVGTQALINLAKSLLPKH